MAGQVCLKPISKDLDCLEVLASQYDTNPLDAKHLPVMFHVTLWVSVKEEPERRKKKRERERENYKNSIKTSNKMALSIYLSIIVVNVNRCANQRT